MPNDEVGVELEWKEGLRFEGRSETGAVTSIDGQGSLSPTPVLLFLEAVGSCSAADVVEILRKGNQEIESLEVSVSGRRRGDPPRRFTTLRFEYRIAGNVERAKAERAVDLSLEKYCSVFHTLRRDLDVSTEVHLSAERRAPS